MMILLALPVITVIAVFHRHLQYCAPSNLLVRRVRTTKPTIRVAVGLLVLAAVLVALMHVLGEAIAADAPDWLNLVVLVLAWDAIKFGVLAVLTALRRAVCVARGIRTSRDCSVSAANCRT